MINICIFRQCRNNKELFIEMLNLLQSKRNSQTEKMNILELEICLLKL